MILINYHANEHISTGSLLRGFAGSLMQIPCAVEASVSSFRLDTMASPRRLRKRDKLNPQPSTLRKTPYTQNHQFKTVMWKGPHSHQRNLHSTEQYEIKIE